MFQEEDKFIGPLTPKKGDNYTLIKRISKKYNTTKYINGLISYLGKKTKLDENDFRLLNQYQRTLQCVNVYYKDIENNLVSGHRYCGRRFCIVCNNIRTAQFINKYKPIISKWEDAHFLTLTVRNTDAAHLSAVVSDMYAALRILSNSKLQRCEGIRKLEITYNEKFNEFHPHYHFILRTKEQACALLEKWLEVHGENATLEAQNIKKCDENSLIELAKYFCKTEKSNGKKSNIMHTHAVHTMYKSILGKRVMQDMGMAKYVKEYNESLKQNQIIQGELFTIDNESIYPEHELTLDELRQENEKMQKIEYEYNDECNMYINKYGEPLIDTKIKTKQLKLYHNPNPFAKCRPKYILGRLKTKTKNKRKYKLYINENAQVDAPVKILTKKQIKINERNAYFAKQQQLTIFDIPNTYSNKTVNKEIEIQKNIGAAKYTAIVQENKNIQTNLRIETIKVLKTFSDYYDKKQQI